MFRASVIVACLLTLLTGGGIAQQHQHGKSEKSAPQHSPTQPGVLREPGPCP
jgi:hypothetical protein